VKKKGFFITFEGIDGSGKSTQIQKLAKFLEDNGFDIIMTREPGGSVGGEEIRNLLLQGEVDRWSAETEILLFTAARRDHLERIILPALQDGKIVICDRFTDSTRMYQGMRGPKLRNLVDNLTEEVINCEPDLTIIIDIDPEISLKRAKSRETAEERFEDFGVDLQKKMRKGFIDLSKEFNFRIKVVNGQQSVDDLAKEIFSLVKARLL
jgi:dTMP kinase|tara:strand:- start:3260 stop:3886 length:627 start_codon:yes stop_codon:yes gene_type:complete